MAINRRISKDSVPVIILAGFLGAGKTTIVNHILRTSVGAKVAVIVNDFGAVNIDSMLISSRTEQKMELTNGCICCSVGDGELEETFEVLLTGIERPDAIIIEASGLAEPSDIAKLVLMSKNKTVAYGGLAYAVDAANYHQALRDYPSLEKQLPSADIIVLTKIEQVTDQAAKDAQAELSAITNVPIVPVKHGELAPELLFDIPERPNAQLSLVQQDHHDHVHLHDAFQTTTFEASDPIAPEKFKDFMNNLSSRGIYRAKGMVYFGINGYEQKYIVQAVGNRWDMYAESWQQGETPHTTMVFIGANFDSDTILKEAGQTVGDSTEMLDIQRYSLAH